MWKGDGSNQVGAVGWMSVDWEMGPGAGQMGPADGWDPRSCIIFLDGYSVFTTIGDAEWGPALENGQKDGSQQSGIVAMNYCRKEKETVSPVVLKRWCLDSSISIMSKLLEMQVLVPTPVPLHQKLWSWAPQSCGKFNRASMWVWCTWSHLVPWAHTQEGRVRILGL